MHDVHMKIQVGHLNLNNMFYTYIRKRKSMVVGFSHVKTSKKKIVRVKRGCKVI